MSVTPRGPMRRVRIAVVAALVPLAVLAPAARAQTTLPEGFSDRLVLGGLDSPVAIAELPDGRVLIAEQNTARLRLLVGGSLAAVDPVCTVDAINTSGVERGLLGVAIDPQWPSRPYVYVHGDATNGKVRISRYTAAGDVAGGGDGALTIDPASRYDLVNDAPDAADNHNGGTVRFGTDGMLYASLGEDADACGAQDSTALKGCILRLDVSRLPAGPGVATRALVTPPDNPFVSSPNLDRRLLWAKGLRNPFRFTVDRADGSLFIADVGEAAWEEIDHATAGGLNFGWPLFEGFASISSCPSALPAPVAPIHVYDHDAGIAVVAGVAYRAPAGARSPWPAAYEGRFLFSDYYTGLLRVLERSGPGWALVPVVNATDWATGFDNVSDYFVGRDGAVWYCRQSVAFAPVSGQVRRLVWGPDTTVTVPPAGVSFAPPFPSPAPGYTTFHYALSRSATVRMRLFDERGRLVRTLVPASRRDPPGDDITWDGRDDAGETARPGIYFVKLEVDGRELTHRVALIR